jgi:predicted unusual protein kinase regulating ubiquinone biosynthesis (AarF/ABC1/UbiB family)
MLGFRFLNFLIFTLVYGVSYLYQTWGKTPNEKKELQGQILSDYLISMGPIYIKIGQILATRSDLISDTIAEKLRRLQDNVPSMNEADTKKIIERGLKQPFETVFQDFSFRPVASASIAQVHQADHHRQHQGTRTYYFQFEHHGGRMQQGLSGRKAMRRLLRIQPDARRPHTHRQTAAL